ncbi:MAG: 1-acyl-sn-glycerol-3-phosphate acyltransferase [Burkholderiales bacterium]|nr:1-acyl-sn-glycerol-3-phosphate acyltransferase [Burkholderiales bacterium]
MRAHFTPIHVRFLRLLRVAGHLLAASWITWARFPRLDPAAREREIRRWSRALLDILNVRVHLAQGPVALPPRCVLVSNHVSWLDVFVVFAVQPAVFVAKSDVRRWPLVGALCERAGTLFIERGSGRHAVHVNGQVAATLAAGRVFAVYPEGTTTDGRTMRPFHRALFQPAIDAAATLQPVAIRYTGPDGAWSGAPVYIDDMSLCDSLWRLVSTQELVAELRFAAPIAAAGTHRRELAHRAETAIAAALGLPAPHRAPGRAPDPPTAPP